MILEVTAICVSVTLNGTLIPQGTVSDLKEVKACKKAKQSHKGTNFSFKNILKLEGLNSETPYAKKVCF